MPEVIRDFTKARKFPNLIGRTPDGKRLLGGPYTITQFVGGGVAAAVLYFLGPLWMHFGAISNAVLFFLLVGGIVFALGRLRLAGRNPISMLQGGINAVTAPRRPPVDGQKVRRGPVYVHAGGVVHPRYREEPPPAVLAPEPVYRPVVAIHNGRAVPARFAALHRSKESPAAVGEQRNPQPTAAASGLKSLLAEAKTETNGGRPKR